MIYKKISAFFFFLFVSSASFSQNRNPFISPEGSKDFQAIEIPNATCGDGENFEVYYKPGNKNDLSIHLQGGGACWDALTCFVMKTGYIALKPFIDALTLYRDDAQSPTSNNSQIYVPYCTGDMHIGTHQAHYYNKTVNHYGRTNLEKTLAHLKKRGIIRSNLNHVLISGDSAGAIGAILNIDLWNQYFKNAKHKSLLADSPGLHYSKKVWARFSPQFIRDFDKRFKAAGYNFQFDTGLISPYLLNMCQKYSQWKVGVIQSTMDIVMSRGFGMVSPIYHRFSVLGKNGIKRVLSNPYDNCSSFVVDSFNHIYLDEKEAGDVEAKDGFSIWDYVEETLDSNRAMYKSHY